MWSVTPKEASALGLSLPSLPPGTAFPVLSGIAFAPCSCSQLLRHQRGFCSGSALSQPDAVSSLTSSPRAPFTVSLKALLEMKAMVPSFLASYPHFHYCKTHKTKFVAIQANIGDFAIVADTWYTGLGTEVEEKVLRSRHSSFMPLRLLWCSLS